MFNLQKQLTRPILAISFALLLVSCGDNNLDGNVIKVESHPLSSQVTIGSIAKLPGHVHEIIKKNNLSSSLNLLPPTRKTRSDRAEFGFSLADIPVCRSRIVVNQLTSSERPLILGEVPAIRDLDNTLTFPSQQDAAIMARNTIPSSGHYFDVVTSRQCLFVTNQDQAVKSLEMVLSDGTEEYLMYATQTGIIYKERRSFDVETTYTTNATVQSYKQNPKDSQLAVYEFSNFDSSGYLINSYFINKNQENDRAYSSTKEFIYSPNDIEFTEANVFVHANLSMQFAIDHGFTPPNIQVSLYPHATMSSGDKNNATYLPSGPSIQIGDGDGEILQNLGLDGDVVSHEVGHHIIFQSLTSTSGQSLVLHEGLADFLTFSRTNDPCLGESICPENPRVNICEMQSQCLRNGKNNIVYLSGNWPQEAHRKGQIISGLLWSLTENYDIDRSIVTKTAIKAISYLAYNSGYRDFILSLMIADKELNNSAYSCNIWDEAVNRGFEDILDGLSCTSNNSVDNIRGVLVSENSSETTARTERSSNSGGSGFCAVTPQSKTANSLISFLLLICIPFLMIAMDRRKSRQNS